MRYFDTTIKGRITNRFSNDLQKVDIGLQGNVKYVLVTLARGAIAVGVLVVNAPWLVAILIPMAFFYLHTMNHYRSSPPSMMGYAPL